MVMPHLTPVQFDLIYNMTSLGLASMGASTVFFFLRLPSFSECYKPALTFTGLVTLIACYHYFRIFESFREAYTPCKVANGVADYNQCDAETYGYSPTGIPFNDAYRYVDWLLTVPLLLIEIVLVMRLSESETTQRCTTLGVAAALMIAFGYPGETSGEAGTRWVFWVISMIPFTYIVYTLFVGLKASQDSQPEEVRNLVKWACWATVFSWCTYPIVYIFPMLAGTADGKAGLTATAICAVQVGYTFSDIISKCGVGYLVYNIGHAKSRLESAHEKYHPANAKTLQNPARDNISHAKSMLESAHEKCDPADVEALQHPEQDEKTRLLVDRDFTGNEPEARAVVG